MRGKHRAGERDMDTSEKRTDEIPVPRSWSCGRKARRHVPTCRAKQRRKRSSSPFITQSRNMTRRRNCPKWRGAAHPTKPWSPLVQCTVEFSGSVPKKSRCRSNKLGEIKKTKRTLRARNFQIVPRKHLRTHQPQVNQGDRASRSTTHSMNPSGSTGQNTQRRN